MPSVSTKTKYYNETFLAISLTFLLSTFFAYFSAFEFSLLFQLILASLFLCIIAIVFNPKRMLISFAILLIFFYLQQVLPNIAIFEIHFALFFFACAFVHEQLYTILVQHINNPKNFFRSAFHGIVLLLLLFVVQIAFSIAAFALGFQEDSMNVYKKVVALPLYIILFAIFYAPLSEELFFRAFLAGRYGIFVSALIFSAFHLLYGSVYELAGTFIIGVILSYYFLKYKNIFALIFAHSAFNLCSVIVMLIIKKG